MTSNSTKNPVLVTGAAGFIAFHLTSQLMKQGFDVIGVDCFDPFYDKKIKLQNVEDLKTLASETPGTFTFYDLDILNLDRLKETNISAIFHLAAKAGVRPSLENPEAYFQTNVTGTLKVLEFAKDRGIKNIVFSSSSSVYGSNEKVPFEESDRTDGPISPYAASKKACELLCYTYAHLYDLRIAALRLFTVYGPRQRPDLAIFKFMKQVLKDEEITLFGDGKTRRDYTFVEDIVSGILASYQWVQKQKAGCEIFNLGRSQTVELVDMVRSIEQATGRTAKIQWQPEQPGDVKQTYSDISKAKKTFGYSPQTSLPAGVQVMVDWYTQKK